MSEPPRLLPEDEQAPRTDITLSSHNGRQEIDFSLDPDGDVYVEISAPRGHEKLSIYLRADSIRRLRDWLNEVQP